MTYFNTNLRDISAPRWRFDIIIAALLTAALLVGTWLYPVTRPYWDSIDQHVFFTLNGLLDHTFFLYVFGVANNRLFDLVPASVLTGCLIKRALEGDEALFRERVAIGVFMAIYIVAATIILRDALQSLSPLRHSPSMVLEPVHRLSQEVAFLHPKDESTKSFPGDHASVITFVAIFLWFYLMRGYGALLAFLTLLFLLPRMTAGAHWFSDVVVGGGAVVLIGTSMALATPLSSYGPLWVHRLLQKRPFTSLLTFVWNCIPLCLKPSNR